MLVDRVLRDLDLPDPDERGGNPLRGSRLGRCARQSAYMLYPKAYPPDPLPARAKLVFRFGDMIHEMVRAEFRRVVPGEWGMEEERFHLRVELTVKETEAALALLHTGALNGTVQDGATLRAFNGPLALRGWRVAIVPEHRRGLWLDVSEPALYVPLHVDGIADLEPFGGEGLASVEIKSMATGSFRRAVQGQVDYAYRVQMAAAVDATGLDTEMYVAVRKDTCHLLEVIYTKKAAEVSVTFTKMSHLSTALGLSLEDGADWEGAEVRHPFEPHLLDQARARVRRILRATVTNLPEREYGPDFTCGTCQGTGTQVKAKNTGLPLKRGPKPCEDCERTLEGLGLPSGLLARAELPFQCRYCPFPIHCWPQAKLEIEDERPHLWITRQDYEASGVTFHGPE